VFYLLHGAFSPHRSLNALFDRHFDHITKRGRKFFLQHLLYPDVQVSSPLAAFTQRTVLDLSPFF
jgi:hypothetical protein